MNKLIREICKRETGKSEVSVGNVRSVLKHLADCMVERHDYFKTFAEYYNVKLAKHIKKIKEKKAKKK